MRVLFATGAVHAHAESSPEVHWPCFGDVHFTHFGKDRPPPKKEKKAAHAQLNKFCKETLAALVKLEHSFLRFRPSIAHIARLDVSLMRGTDGELSYFVNEVTRGTRFVLFLRCFTPEKIVEVANRVLWQCCQFQCGIATTNDT